MVDCSEILTLSAAAVFVVTYGYSTFKAIRKSNAKIRELEKEYSMLNGEPPTEIAEKCRVFHGKIHPGMYKVDLSKAVVRRLEEMYTDVYGDRPAELKSQCRSVLGIVNNDSYKSKIYEALEMRMMTC
jgi:hypothetical protein